MPGKIKFRIKITEIIIITKTSSTIDDDIRFNVTPHTHTYRTCHDHLQFTPMNEIPTLFCHPIRNTSHCLWLERKYLSNPFYLITEIFTSSSPRPHCALNGPLSSRTHLPWTFSQYFPITNSDVITTSKTSPACSQARSSQNRLRRHEPHPWRKGLQEDLPHRASHYWPQ